MQDELKGKGLDEKLRYKISLIFKYYYLHFKGLTDENKVYLITDNHQSKKEYIEIFKSVILDFKKEKCDISKYILTLNEYIEMNKK